MESQCAQRQRKIAYVHLQFAPQVEEDDERYDAQSGEQIRHKTSGSLFRLAELMNDFGSCGSDRCAAGG